mgnify:CR=1 FL=1
MKHTIETKFGHIVIEESDSRVNIEIHTDRLTFGQKYETFFNKFNVVAKNVGITGIIGPDIEFNVDEVVREINTKQEKDAQKGNWSTEMTLDHNANLYGKKPR